ncbi:transporter substrate-binding domain-containing protein [Enterobacter cloacae subsp. cloacae]|uniref:ATP-binding protein n=1 Tax=Enterobacter cloacae TaxID=550 RepID=UPI00197F41BD|nr:transporter substrate-binding domain-containing protein [Enterobacter cloacae]MBN4758759.1 transporter substrate-binding domain-containing protein [Enterobacter cloacae]MCU6309293.1 transporter substrate-binding domain-containing protein [Enterobacter cloacae]WLD31568.1 transporter substrate-binding domain-containing protein [Enterobacter cloacae subsp. cloacae]HDC4684644.1 transporter substrate-binding domain-containing protein [Enterobacter cloacae]
MRAVTFILLFCIAFTVCAAQQEESLRLLARSHEKVIEPGLSGSEWRWVREHRKIRLAVWEPMMPPYDITTGLNDYGGINADFTGLVAENLGLEIEVVRYPTYDDALSALRAGKADFMPQAGDSQQKQGLMLSVPYSDNIPVEVVNTDASPDEPVKRIAVSPVYSRSDVLARYPGADIVNFSSTRHALEALAFREIDLFFSDAITARYLASQSNLSNLSIRPVADTFEASGFSFAAMPKMAVWIAILNKMLMALPENAGVEIHRRWSGGIPLSLSEEPPRYTSLEHKWIKEHSRIRVAVAQDNSPIAFFNERGQLRGILADLLTALRLRTGFTFEIRRYPSQAAAFRAINRGEAELIAGVTQEGIWQADLLTTRTWLYNSWVMVGRALPGKEALQPRVVSLRGEAPDGWLGRQNSGQTAKVDTWWQGFNSVVKDKNDMMVVPLIIANAQLTRKEFASLKILASIDAEPLRFAFGASRQAWPLITILNKALINIPPEDLHALTRGSNTGNAFASVSTSALSITWLVTFTAAGLALLALVAGWIYRRRRIQQARIRKLIQTLRAAKQRAERARRGKSAFLATMSHEIRTPVSAIIGMLELVMKRPDHAPQNPQSIRVAWDAAQSLLLLIGNILDVERIVSGRLVLRPERASLRNLIEGTVSQFEGLAAQKSLKLLLEMDTALKGDILIDVMRFRQIVTNLLGNAIKFTDHGQVMLRAQPQWQNGEFMLLELTIADTGEGIDIATQQRLFQPFSQGESRTRAQGSGLGLYICRQLADMMDGDLTLNSVPGEGTTVTVTLRLPVMAALPEKETKACVPPGKRAALTIMVVDDNPVGRMLLTQQLEWLGHAVTQHDSPAKLLESLAIRQPDAVITDCNMPEMSGYALSRIINEHYPCVTVFGMTADARESVRDEAREAGMRDCIFKPVTLVALENLLAPLAPSGKSPVASSYSISLPPALLDGEHLATFLDLQITVLEETLGDIALWRKDPGTPLKDALHRLRGGIQLLGMTALEARCLEQERAADSGGIRQLEEEIQALRAALQRWRETGLQPGETVLQQNEDGRTA